MTPESAKNKRQDPETDSSDAVVRAFFSGELPEDIELEGVEIDRGEDVMAFLDSPKIIEPNDPRDATGLGPSERSMTEFSSDIQIRRLPTSVDNLPDTTPPHQTQSENEETPDEITPGESLVENETTSVSDDSSLVSYQRFADLSITLVIVGLALLGISVANPVIPGSLAGGSPTPINELVPLFLIAEGVLILSGVAGWLYGRRRYE